jgi:hypothetical protein
VGYVGSQNYTGSGSSLNAGTYLWTSAEYNIHKGLDGTFVPYFSRWLYALSSDLARDIAYDPNSVLEGMYAGYAGDLQLGRWVNKKANRADPKRQIDSVTEPSLLWEIEGTNECQNWMGIEEVAAVLHF